MERPTADQIYERARLALVSAEAAASRHDTVEVARFVQIATAWRELAESLADRERRPVKRGQGGGLPHGPTVLS